MTVVSEIVRPYAIVRARLLHACAVNNVQKKKKKKKKIVIFRSQPAIYGHINDLRRQKGDKLGLLAMAQHRIVSGVKGFKAKQAKRNGQGSLQTG